MEDLHDYYIKDWQLQYHLSLANGFETFKSGVLICPTNMKLHLQTVCMTAIKEDEIERVRFYIGGAEEHFINGGEFEKFYKLNPVHPDDINWIVQ